jgi:hypothetical protein
MRRSLETRYGVTNTSGEVQFLSTIHPSSPCQDTVLFGVNSPPSASVLEHASYRFFHSSAGFLHLKHGINHPFII